MKFNNKSELIEHVLEESGSVTIVNGSNDAVLICKYPFNDGLVIRESGSDGVPSNQVYISRETLAVMIKLMTD